ncbi:preprotein translocase subunit SecG [Hymenobacter rubripertinctus]|uniref:Protein-export membrane protein SecG n=1 Tax=Hymenobacter rubripertinctus TaxID=2029981 RepID=A0A418QU34_9BACT|nr:preprotein translocase subunit SecG [Hymenobacter rubripertinctus]RIY08611.1 preprotein translocase subunit SecG [Hymenobacter rubripertinctus]
MYYALIGLILLVCLLLSLVVLAQNPKGGGISSQFGAGGATQMMGVKRTGDLLEKLTWGFAIGLMVLSLGSYVVGGPSQSGPVRSINQQKALETRMPAQPAPGAPAAAPATAPAAPAPTPAPAPAN